MIKYCVLERPSAACKKPVHSALDRRYRVVCLTEERYYFELHDCSLPVADKPLCALPRARRCERLKKASIKRVKSVGAVWWKRKEDDAMLLREVDDFKSLVALVAIHIWFRFHQENISRICGLSFVHPVMETKRRIHIKNKAESIYREPRSLTPSMS